MSVSRFRLEVATATGAGAVRERGGERFAGSLARPGESSSSSVSLLVGGERGGVETSRLAFERVLDELSSQAAAVAAGDSRCYRVRRGEIERLTGGGPPPAADGAAPPAAGSEPVEDGDLYILCSDALIRALPESEILRIAMRFDDPRELAEALVAVADGRNGSDHVTSVVCRCRDARRETQEPEATEPILRPDRLASAARWPKARLAWAAVVVAIVVVAFFVVPRILAARAYERGVEHARQGRYLHARVELARAIHWGLDRERTEDLIDLLLSFPSPGREEETSPEEPPPPPR